MAQNQDRTMENCRILDSNDTYTEYECSVYGCKYYAFFTASAYYHNPDLQLDKSNFNVFCGNCWKQKYLSEDFVSKIKKTN